MAEKHFLEFEKPLLEVFNKIQDLRRLSGESGIDLQEEITAMEERANGLRAEIFKCLTAVQTVQVARHPDRPSLMDYVKLIFTDFVELKGDRLFADDRAMVGGLAKLDGQGVVIVGHQKGKNTKENIYRNFGMANPEGYRKARRLFRLGEKFGLPIICFIDTPGAFPGLEGEERGIAEAIARNLREMFGIKTPILVVITGEGGSGGAIGIGVGDAVLILQYAYYSVITPEACSAILWRDTSKSAEATQNLHLTAEDLLELDVVDEIIPEPLGGAHNDHSRTAANVKTVIKKQLKKLNKMPIDELLRSRYQKYRRLGRYLENGEPSWK